ncbi:hypothetical protein [Novosphingobium sp. KACC 22771]|uniref:hypothetical protein n=1 Tax=Novosphingobium sp. KACC 22771 TaxID=3025670 RepID=UPI00236536C3|nr:hypothetical protein [Novosphingobium sp. KACC 22771]WDF73950.1 hypothetical protein PQ467_07925 [Novosphingobium sp. KACC 22771]
MIGNGPFQSWQANSYLHSIAKPRSGDGFLSGVMLMIFAYCGKLSQDMQTPPPNMELV